MMEKIYQISTGATAAEGWVAPRKTGIWQMGVNYWRT